MIRKKKLMHPIVCVVAMNKHRVIGDGKKLLWHLPDDLKRLKSITMGAPLIMGRKTWESIGRPLPGRANIVLTHSVSHKIKDAIVVNSFESAIEKADLWIINNKAKSELKIQKNIYLFGGAEIYNLGLDFCDTIHMTLVELNINNGSKFPKINEHEWEKIKLESFDKNINSPAFSYWVYQRIN